MAKIRVACLQIEPPTTELRHAHQKAVVAQIEAAASAADLVVLPELWPAGYFAFDDYRDVATPLDGPLVGELATVARRLGITLVAGSVVERGEGDRLHNTSLAFGPDGQRLAAYRKVHVFGYGSREQELVTGGRELATFPVGPDGDRVGMVICYDLRFPELFRQLTGQVAMYVVVAAWPAARAEHWSVLLRARAIENQAYVVACNAAGSDHGVALAGRSMVIDPWGIVLAQAGQGMARLEATVDLDAVAAVRAEMPVLRDRRLPAGEGGPGGAGARSRPRGALPPERS